MRCIALKRKRTCTCIIIAYLSLPPRTRSPVCRAYRYLRDLRIPHKLSVEEEDVIIMAA